MDNDFPTMLAGQPNRKQGFIGAMLKGLDPFMNNIPQHHQAIQPLFGFIWEFPKMMMIISK